MVGMVFGYVGVLLGAQVACTSSGSTEPVCPPCGTERKDSQATSSAHHHSFPATIANFIVDFATVDRVKLNELLEIGVPFDQTRTGAEDALILYPSAKSRPSVKKPRLTAEEATKNCQTVKMVLTEPIQRDTCIALMPQWESYTVHKFMRMPKVGGIDPKQPLRYVSRSHNIKGQRTGVPDYKRNTEPSYKELVEYLGALDATVAELKPILQPIATPKKSVIVSVVNYGQALLFENFLCNAKAKGLDTSHILLFATDDKTYKLAKEYGVAVYYNAAIFGDLPEEAAKGYGDRTFTRMMMAKVYCVHLVISCGYNVLFQDVDLVWYRDPLPYLESKELAEWDMMFQDDGARSQRYAPFSPNTGFYFVRYTPESLFFFGMLMRQGDVIARTTSHQAALTTLLNEHVSWQGLRVKVWSKGEGNPFPGGGEYHRSKPYMQSLIKYNKNELDKRMGEKVTYTNLEPLKQTPYIFHMSWTKNKDNKKLYFEQMGEWYLKEACTGGPTECCLANPNIVCHYRDKPSLVDCSKSPPIDPGGSSFW